MFGEKENEGKCRKVTSEAMWERKSRLWNVDVDVDVDVHLSKAESKSVIEDKSEDFESSTLFENAENYFCGAEN